MTLLRTTHRRERGVALLAFSALIGLGLTARADNPAGRKPAGEPKGKAAATTAPASAALRLGYRLQAGDNMRYKLVGYFTGHFPPFDSPGSPPVILRTKLTYVANVKKADEKGAEVAFSVEEADVAILLKEPGPNGEIAPDDEAPIPLPLSQVQKALNVTATMKPDGSITKLTGGETGSVKIDLGFELRKLFLLMMPVTFPEKPLKVADEWTFTDGVLGNKPGKVSYKGRVQSVQPGGKAVTVGINQEAEARIEDMRDKEGKPTDKAADSVDTTTGKLTFGGTMRFLAPTKGKLVNGSRAVGRMAEGKMTLNALLTRKRTTPDPEHPDDPLEKNIDVAARLTVQADDLPTQTMKRTASGKESLPSVAAKTKEKSKP